MGMLRAAVIGAGFVGRAHIESLRRQGIPVVGVLGSSRDRAAESARALRIDRAYSSLDELAKDKEVDVVHICTPNHLHAEQTTVLMRAGKHVMCEKPLAMNTKESAQLIDLARKENRVGGVTYNLRYYPLCQQARAMVDAGAIAEPRLVHGSFLQDCLLYPTDWNWRLEPDKGGELRAVGDIGSHWLDLVQFVTGLEVQEIFADLAAAIPVRERPLGEVETFGSAAGGERVEVEMTTEDFAHILVRFRGGARGSCVVSQVSAGRKNAIGFEVSGSRSALAWEGERPEELWLGNRDTPNAMLLRNAALMDPAARETTHLPAGHAEGFAETFRELYRAVYGAVAAGEPADDYPTFSAGHVENVLAEAVALSNTEQRWVEVTP